MKNKLLITTGLVFALSLTTSYAKNDKVKVIPTKATAEVKSEAAPAKEMLHIMSKDDNKSFTAGGITFTRTMTPCAKNKGWLQVLVPFEGVNPVTEIDILKSLDDKDSLLVDMRTQDWFADATIPTAINIPYTEVAGRMDELGCTKSEGKFNCANAKKVYAFCNGPVCPQSPMAMKAMIRDGFPADKIYYYRGGMLDWSALGLNTVEGDF